MRAESLQWRAPRSFEAFIATWTIAGVAEKVLEDALCDDPRARLSGVMVDLQPVATVLDDECFVAAVSCGRSQSAAIAAGLSTATTAAPSPGTPGCNSAPSHAPAETSFRILSTNTCALAAVVIAACSVALCPAVAFSGGLSDLVWGSWEGSLPESSSLGGDRTPLRGAFIIASAFGRDSLREKLYQLCRPGDILIAHHHQTIDTGIGRVSV
jgi:hypothetical protein